MPPRKKDIFISTKHLDCNQLGRIQKFNYSKKGIPQGLQIVTTPAYSKIRLLQSCRQICGLRWRFSFQTFMFSPKQNYRMKYWYIEKSGRRKAQLLIFRGLNSNEPVYGCFVIVDFLSKTLKKYPYKPKTVQTLTDQHKLSRVECCNWRSIWVHTEVLQENTWSLIFYCEYFLFKYPTLGNTNNITV